MALQVTGRFYLSDIKRHQLEDSKLLPSELKIPKKENPSL
jgi:hypothetical protein